MNKTVILITLLLSLTAGIFNALVVVVGPQYLKVRCAAIATLAFLYVISYSWLLLNWGEANITDWSNFMRGVSILPWLVVWIAPATSHLKFTRDLELKLQKQIEEMRREEDGG